MKDKILMLIIGILIGAIIASGCFLVFGKGDKYDNDKMNGRNFDVNMIDGTKRGTPPNMDRNNLDNPTDDTNNASEDV